MSDESCPRCGTAVVHASGIGNFCPNKKCDAADDLRPDWQDRPSLFTHQPAGLTAYTFRIAWSAEDGEWVGTCDQLPSLSYLHHDPVEAAEWICSLAADYLDEAKETTDV
jgi:hypothetical protein